MQFNYNHYTYWFSIVDCVYYKQKDNSLDKIEVSKEEFDMADEARWKQYK